MSEKRQNEFSDGYSQNVDMRLREDEIIDFIKEEMGFKPDEVISRSTWWGSERTGAFQCSGAYEGKQSILKIQGVKPMTSEIDALEAIANAENPHATIRAPHLYANRRWDDDKKFEALIVERILSPKLINLPTTQDEVKKFFDLYKNYVQYLNPTPWVSFPDKSPADMAREKVEDQRSTAGELYPDYPYRQSDDEHLIGEGLRAVTENLNGLPLTFQHSHISTDDVFLPNDEDPRYIFTSNFVWGWTTPFKDALQARHHFPRLLIDRGGKLTPDIVDEQTSWWDEQLELLSKTDDEKRYMNVARLDLALGALGIDNLTLDPSNSLAPYLMESTRSYIKELIDKLS